MDLSLKDRVVLITGSSRGLGKAIARVFLAEGSKVTVTGQNHVTVAATAKELSENFDSSRICSYAADLTKSASIAACVDHVITQFGRIDILVANMGSGKGMTAWHVPESEWMRMMELNFQGARRMTDLVVPHMMTQGTGSIVHIASIAGIESIASPLPYSVAKASLIAWSTNLAHRLGSHGIRVNVVCPGNIFIEGGTWDIRGKENPAGVADMLARSVPLNRFARPEEVAGVVAFVSSERASFMTGSCVVVDGGQTLSL